MGEIVRVWFIGFKLGGGGGVVIGGGFDEFGVVVVGGGGGWVFVELVVEGDGVGMVFEVWRDGIFEFVFEWYYY